MNSKTVLDLTLRAALLSMLALASAARAADATLAYISPGIGTLIATWWAMLG